VSEAITSSSRSSSGPITAAGFSSGPGAAAAETPTSQQKKRTWRSSCRSGAAASTGAPLATAAGAFGKGAGAVAGTGAVWPAEAQARQPPSRPDAVT
jgi:hypothetical protein